MKKRTLTSIATVAVVLTMTTAFAAGNVVMFGDNAQRTHVNGITDTPIWATEATIKSINVDGISLSGSQMNSSSTAIGAGNLMYFPISAGSDSNHFQGTGYITLWDMSKWSGGNPTPLAAMQIPNVSNSSPIFDPTTGDAYLAAGTEFYRFYWTGTTLQKTPVSIGGTGDLNGGQNYNQVVSYPLYVSASELGTSSDEIFVTTQNGYLYEIDPNTMAVTHVNLGVRFDASPSLVTATDGTKYIAVTGAYDANNASYGGSSGTGMLFLINPTTGQYKYLANPYTPISSVASPVATSQGHVMWNDTEGDVFFAQIQPDGELFGVKKWQNIGNGQTSYLSESGYANGQYIVPFTDQGTYGYATVDPNVSTNQVEQYGASGSSGQLYPMGSPEISASGNMYLADQAGGIDRISPNPSNGNLYDGTQGGWLPSFGSSSGTPLSTPSELELDTPSNGEQPTLTLATDQGLELWANTYGEDLTFAQNYTSSSATQFSQPLTLTPSGSSLPTDPGNTDKIDFDMIVNGGTKMDNIGSISTFDSAGNPIATAITIPTSTLNTWLSNYESSYPNAWNSSSQNNVVIEAYPDKNDAFTYQFKGSNAASDGSFAEVEVVFPAPGSVLPTPPSGPTLECVEQGDLSCSSAMPTNPSTGDGYVEWRFLPPGMLNTNEGQNFTLPTPPPTGSDPIQGSPIAYKIHPIPEQAINSTPAEQYSAYYTYQDNPDGHSDPSKDIETGNWLNNYTVEFINGSGLDANFNLSGEMQTTGDMLYKKTYIGAWQPHWTWISFPLGGGYWQWDGYTPIYDTEYLYRNVAINEKIPSTTLNLQNSVTYWWNPSTVNVTATGTFDSTETPITPNGSSMSWTQPVWAAYGPWVPAGSTEGTRFSQVPVTPGLNNSNTEGLTPNSILSGTQSDTDTFAAGVQPPDKLNGVWYSDAPMPPIPAGGDFSLQGAPTSNQFDAEHNGGVLYEPQSADYGKVGQWWVMPVYSVSGTSSPNFEHDQISEWIPTWSKPWANNGGQGVVSTSTSTVTWNN